MSAKSYEFCNKQRKTNPIWIKANNSTKDNEFRKDKFKYDPEKDVYICPAEQQLYFFENTSKNGMKYK